MKNRSGTSPGFNEKVKVGVLSPLSADTLEELHERYDCTVGFNPSVNEKRRILAEAEIVILRSPVRLDEQALRSAQALKLIVRAGVGLDSIDLGFAERAGIQVISVPLSGRSVAEHVFGLILSLYRRIPSFHQSMKEGRWEKHDGLGRELFGKTVGLVGLGRIGRAVAQLAHGFGMTMLAYDRSPEKQVKQDCARKYGLVFTDLDRIFTASDMISIQVPLNEETRSLIGAGLLNRMRDHAVLVNVGRGKVVDEQALYAILSEGRILGAALDVFAHEPVHGHRLLELDNFIGTPHVGAQTVEAQQRVGMDVLRIIASYIGNKKPA